MLQRLLINFIRCIFRTTQTILILIIPVKID